MTELLTAAPDSLVSTTVERDYHHALRREGVHWWRGAVAIVAFYAAYLVVAVALSFGAVAIGGLPDAAGGAPFTLTPIMLLTVNLSAAAMIPLAMLLQWGLFGVRPRWLHSIAGRFRWGLLGRVARIVVPLWLVYVAVFALAPLPGQPSMNAGVSVPMLLVVLLTTWLQAAGEEYGSRGLVTRSVGSWFASPRTALVVSALVANALFALSHLAADPWLIAYYFVFGLSGSLVTWRTGGLEASSLVHATNNLLLFAVIAVFNHGQASFDRSVGVGGPFMLAPMAMMIAVALLISWWAHRRAVRRTQSVVVRTAPAAAQAPSVPAAV